MKKVAILFLTTIVILSLSGLSAAAGKVLFGFETPTGTQGWEIPEWALEQEDMVGKEITVAKDFSTEGKNSLVVTAEYPGDKWAGAIAEVAEYFDWTPYGKISVDVYLPPSAPAGLKGKVILTVGEDWKWTEMSKAMQLLPGQVTTITANLKPGSEDWKKTVVDENFRKDVRKLAIRVESNKPAYKGKIYIDNVRLE